ncbi:MAG: amidohydrolase family protein [Gammaproteobacteria bacterium]
MRIDVHSHFMSAAIARELERRSEFPYTRFVDGTYHFHCCKNLTVPMVPALTDVATKIAHMDEAGIDVSILSLALPGPDRVGGALADDLARSANDLLAEIVAARPERFWGYATLGFGDIDATLAELDRCIGTLGFRGLQLYSNINDRPLDAPEFRPVFARMAELGLPIFIHPTVPLNQRYLLDLVPVPVLALIVDSTLAAMRLALSGVLTEYAAAPVIIPHVGATVPYLLGRLNGMLGDFGGEEIEHDPGRALRELHMDTVTYEPEALAWCLSLMGADKLLLGTDYPYGPWRTPIELVERLECPADERDQILHGNAERLFAAGPAASA